MSGGAYPEVKGRCPACGLQTLFLAEGGHVVCSWEECRDPGAADQLLLNRTVAAPSDDPNRDLGPYVEGFIMGLIDMQRLGNLPPGWKHLFTNDERGVHALYFISPSDLRWRIRAVLEETPEGGS